MKRRTKFEGRKGVDNINIRSIPKSEYFHSVAVSILFLKGGCLFGLIFNIILTPT